MKHPRNKLLSGVIALIVLFFVGCATNQAPKAAFSIDSLTGTTAHSFAFHAGSSSDPEGAALSFTWDFGDGTDGTSEKVDHQFATPGIYVVELTVTDEAGKVDEAEETVLVSHTLSGLSSEFMELMMELNELSDAMSTDPAFLAVASFPNPSLVLPVSNLAQLVLPGGLLRPDATLQDLLPHLVDQTLWTGEFAWNPSGGIWDPVDDTAENLILRWPFDDAGTPKTAELVLDWDAGAPIKEVDDGFGFMLEVPVSMSATLTVDEVPAGDLVLDFGWYAGPPCSDAIFQPETVAVVGGIGLNSVFTIGDAIGDPVLPAELAVTDNASGLDELTSHGDVGFSWDGNSVMGSWDVSLFGLISRFPAGETRACFIDFGNTPVDGVTLDLEVVSDAAGEGTDFHLLVDLTSVDLATGMGDVAGSLKIDGIDTLTLAGTLEDSDGDFVPDIDLTDADGSVQSLADFLESLAPEMGASLLGSIRIR